MCSGESSWLGHNPSGRTMALEATQLLTEMSTGDTSCGVKAASASGPVTGTALPFTKCHKSSGEDCQPQLRGGALSFTFPSGNR